MGMYREAIKKRYEEVGDMARKQAQEQSDHKQTIDMVNSPPHYNKAGIETIDAIMAATDEGSEYYLQGNIIKYVWRYRYKNGVEVGQIYNVGIAKQIIHPITKKVMSGTTFTKIGEIKVISTQADVATCEIIEDLGINTYVEGEKLPLARLATE